MGIQKAFSRVTVRDFIANVKALREREIVSISTNVTLKHTLDLLTSHNYTSCPVKGEDGQSWIGFVDMMDIVSWVIEGCVQSHATTTSAERTTPVLEWRIEEGVLERRGEELLTHTTSSIINSSNCNPFSPIDDSSTMSQLVVALCAAHRVPVRDAQGTVKHIITQSAMIQFLNANTAVVGELAHTQLRELGFGPDDSLRPVITILESDPAIVGLYKIKANRISAVAVVNDAGEYVATLSVSDLKGLAPKALPSLLKPCRKYLQDRHGGSLPSMMCCTSTTTFQEAVNLLAVWHIHRLWITDSQMRPVAALTLSSVIRLLTIDQ